MSISKSAKPVNLSDVIEALEIMPEEWSAYMSILQSVFDEGIV